METSIIASMPFGVLDLDMQEAWGIVKRLPEFDTARPAQILEQQSVCALVNGSFIRSSNAAGLALTGRAEQMVPIAAILPEESHRLFAESLFAVMTDGKDVSFETTLKTGKEDEIHVLASMWSTSPQKWSGDMFLGLTNITRQVSSEEAKENLGSELAHASRISMLGEMTASIAHEINQPLSSVVTSAEAGLRWLNRDEPDLAEVSAILERIVKNGNRAAEIITAMRAMARNSKPERLPVAINTIVEEAVLILRSEISKRQVGLQLELGESLPFAPIDRTQILQVVVNLALNAAQAMSEGLAWNRTLKIRTGADNANVVLEVEDSGPGVDPGVRAKLFDSFYTTKQSGMGIGLSITRSIIEAHEGVIELESSPNLGARFIVRLPHAHM